jgi:hypothetical protein
MSNFLEFYKITTNLKGISEACETFLTVLFLFKLGRVQIQLPDTIITIKKGNSYPYQTPYLFEKINGQGHLKVKVSSTF